MSAGIEQTATTNWPIRETPKVSPELKPNENTSHDANHGGIYSRMREIMAAGGAQEPPPLSLAPIFRSADFSHPVNDGQKARALQTLQQTYGNRYVQRVLDGDAGTSAGAVFPSLVQRSEASATADATPLPALDQSSGHSLDNSTQNSMGASLNHDFSDVRIHDDSASHQAAKNLNASAFTTGRDVYFSQGAYNPTSDSGRKLLAHELTHVVQQSQGTAGPSASSFSVSHPSDPLERQADQVSDAVIRGEMFPPITTSSRPAVHRQAHGAPPPAAPPRPATPTSGAGTPAGGTGRAATGAGGTGTTPARAGDFAFTAAGIPVVIPLRSWLERQAPGSIAVPESYLKKAAFPGFKLTSATLDLDEDKLPNSATIGVGLAVPPLTGDGTLTIDKNRNASGTAHVVFSPQKIPGLKQTTVDARITKDDFAFDANVDFDLPKVTGNLQYKYENGKHSGKGKADYQGAKMRGSIEIIMSEAGLISGSGMLDMELFKGLQGQANVAVDEKRNIKVRGKLSVPGEIVLFPEKKYEKSFFNFEKKFPIWGITIPVIDVNVGIFAEIHAGAGFRSKFGPGVLRGIELTGEFGTDPEAATEFGLGGEFFVPAGAEIVVNVGGGIGLGLAIADITGGIEAIGVAGLYTALTVRPQFKYAGGKYTISGMAELAGVAQVKFGINAFAKIDVGVWLFKGTVWRRDWTLAEWIWNTGLNIALRANISYTLGDDFAPEISFETGQVDPEKFIKDAMPESGSPVPAPPKPAVPEKGSFTAEGATGGQAGGAPSGGPTPQTPGAVHAATQTAGAGPAGTATQAPPDGEQRIVAHQRTRGGHEIKITESGEVLRFSNPLDLRAVHGAFVAPHRDLERWLRRIEQNARTKAPAVQAQAAQDAAVFDPVMTTLAAAEASGQLVIDPGRTFTEAEARMAARLLDEGRRVRAVASAAARTGDFEVDGRSTEAKEVSNITATERAGALVRIILGGAGQAPDIIADTRRQPEITRPIAENAIERVYTKQRIDFEQGRIPSLRIQNIRVIGNGFDISVPRT